MILFSCITLLKKSRNYDTLSLVIAIVAGVYGFIVNVLLLSRNRAELYTRTPIVIFAMLLSNKIEKR